MSYKMWMLTSSTCSCCDAMIYGSKEHQLVLKLEMVPWMLVLLVVLSTSPLTKFSHPFHLSTKYGKKGRRQQNNTSKTLKIAQVLLKGRSDVNYLSADCLIFSRWNYNFAVTPVAIVLIFDHLSLFKVGQKCQENSSLMILM